MSRKSRATEIPGDIQEPGEKYSINVWIRGLQGAANLLFKYPDPSEDIIAEINRTVNRIVDDAGWKGDDANRFSHAWKADTNDALRLSRLVYKSAAILDDCAQALCELQRSVNDHVIQINSEEGGNLANKEQELMDWAFSQSKKIQNEYAGKLRNLYTVGKAKPKWLITEVKSRMRDPLAPEELRDRLKDADDELDDTLPDEDFDWEGLLTWTTGGAAVGGVIGGVAGLGVLSEATAPAGAAILGVGGFVVGGIVGGGKWAADKIDDWF